jgi:hypothetical protein
LFLVRTRASSKKQQRVLARQQQKTQRPKSLESMVNDVERRQNVFDHENISIVRD